MQFRDLTADDIEVRVQSSKWGRVTLLLYKNARVDMAILDETVGAENWQREHYECKGNLFCRVGVKTEDNGWVWKADCGVESNAEKEKGEASDSFKRACTNWGIGRELYTSPIIQIPEENVRMKDGKCIDRFKVEKVKVENKKIVGLAIKNRDDKRVFVYAPTKEQ